MLLSFFRKTLQGGRDNGTNSPTSAEKQQQTKDNVIKDDNELRDTVYGTYITIFPS